MGIERFFSSVENGVLTKNTVALINKPLNGDHLFIDYNSIIHVTSQGIIHDLNKLLYSYLRRRPRIVEEILKKYQLKMKDQNEYQLWLSDSKNIDQLIIDQVSKATLALITELTNTKLLKTIYLAIDGVPSKGKIAEQKKRRYMGAVISHYKKRMFTKYEKQLSKDEIRYAYEKGKISWSKSLITPGTVFMDHLYYHLIDQKFIKELKTLCPKLKEYHVSGPYEPGEGEKKIVNYIYNNPLPKDRYFIYSPDADVSLLALLLTVKRSNYPGIPSMIVLRHNQQKNEHNSIDAQKLGDNIYQYIKKQIPKIGYDRVINEVVFVFTVFGNDFLPKIESFNVKNDFELILKRYIGLLEKLPEEPLIHEVGEKLHLNLGVLKLLIKVLHFDEGGQLQRSYLGNKYKNVSWMRRLLNAPQHGFLKKMSEFLGKIKAVYRALDQNQEPKESLLDDEFKGQIQRLMRQKGKTLTDGQLLALMRDKRKLQSELKLRSFFRSIEDRFHKERLRSGLHEEITEYDKEVYQFEHMLDSYREKLDAFPIDLGRIRLDVKRWAWDAEKIEKGVERYYYNYFGIDKMKQKKLDHLMFEYLEGIFWVFNYYYNEYDDRMLQTASTWSFAHHKAPLMTQLYHYLNRNSMDDLKERLLSSIQRFRVDRIDFFNCIEHFMYVTPAPSMMELIPEEYQSFVVESNYYPDLSRLVEEFHQGKTRIDCRGQIFLNKCHLKIKESEMSDQAFIRKIRKIKVSEGTRRRQGKMGGDMEPFVFVF